MKRTQRFIALILALITITSIAVVPAAAADTRRPVCGFIDVKDTAWYAEAVKWAVEKGITCGTSENKFSPKLELRRNHLVTFLWRFAGSPKDYSIVNNLAGCSDPGAWFYQPMHWAAYHGIIGTTKGTGNPEIDKQFPKAEMTRNDFVKMLYNFMFYSMKSRYGVNFKSYDDVKNYTYALKEYTDAADFGYTQKVSWGFAVKHGIISGTSDTTLSPDTKVTRAQCVTMLYRMSQNRPDRFEAAKLGMSTSTFTSQKKKMLWYAESKLGCPYGNFSNGEAYTSYETGIDCTHYVQDIYKKFYGITLPSGTSAYSTNGYYSNDKVQSWAWYATKKSNQTSVQFVEANKNNLQFGDILFMPGHVMMYVGKDANGRMIIIHATRPEIQMHYLNTTSFASPPYQGEDDFYVKQITAIYRPKNIG